MASFGADGSHGKQASAPLLHEASSLQAAGSLADRINATALNDHAQQDDMRQTANAAPGPQSEDRSPVSVSSLKALFEEQHRYLDHFFQQLDYGPIERFCQACMGCKGTILFTGVGKSGFIAQKISQTLVSTGTKAVFLSPTDALHGDIGIVGEADLLVAFSKSGGSEELLKLLPFAKAKGATLVSVTSVPGCRLEAICDMAVVLPLVRELCPFDLAPVTSTAIQMLFGDTVAIALMQLTKKLCELAGEDTDQAKKLTQEQYAMNHPAGRIGKRLTLRVADVMLAGSALPLVAHETTVVDVLTELSSKGQAWRHQKLNLMPDSVLDAAAQHAARRSRSHHAQGCVLVVQGEQLAGTFTDGDLRRALQARGADLLATPVGEVMTKAPRTCPSTLKAIDAMQGMEHPTKVTFLPVVDEGHLTGLVTLHGLVSAGL